MHVHVPQPRHEIRAFEVDHLRVADGGLPAVGEDLADTAVLDDDARVRSGRRIDAIDQRRVDQYGSHVHSGLMPASWATFSHRFDSDSIKARNSAGLFPTGSKPRSLKPCAKSGARRMFAISLCSRSTTAAGVRAGASTPNHVPP